MLNSFKLLKFRINLKTILNNGQKKDWSDFEPGKLETKKRTFFVNLIFFRLRITSYRSWYRARARIKRKRSRRDRSLRKELHGHERRRSFFDDSRWKREFRIESRTHLADINPTAHYRRVCHRVARAWCDGGGGEMPKKVSATGVLDSQQFRFRKRVWAVGEVATLTLQTGWCWKLKNWSPGDCGGQAICHDAVHLGTSCQAASLSPKKELASGIECSHAGVSYFCRIISGEKKRKRWWFRNGNLRIFRLARRQFKQGTRSCCTCSLPSLGLYNLKLNSF